MYAPDVKDAVCEHIASGKSIREIAKLDGMPSMPTVFRWLTEDKLFQEQYARAREAQADTLFEEMLEIADDATNDWMERNGQDNAGWQLNGEHVQRSKLRIEARKWMAGKLRPKVYGDKVELAGPGGGPIQFEKIVREVVDPK